MRTRRLLRAIFGVTAILLICAYFYMRVEHFPKDRIHDIWIVAMVCCWISVFVAWKDKPSKDS